jgi:hypothetical protein
MPYEKVLIDEWAPQTRPRPAATKSTPELDREENERSRLSKREAVRKQIAEAKLAEVRMHETDAAIAAIEATKEAAADEHVQKCSPWQTELRQIEAAQLERIRAGKDLDSACEERRKVLLDQIQSENEALENFIAAKDRLIATLQTERLEFAREAHWQGHEADLLELVPRETQMRLRMLSRQVDLDEARLRATNDRLESLAVNDRGGLTSYAIIERDAAAERLTRSRRELEEATRAAIEE